jgi:hypothetical protein
MQNKYMHSRWYAAFGDNVNPPISRATKNSCGHDRLFHILAFNV